MNYNELFGGSGGSVDPWVSGATVNQWAYRQSQVDGEIYQRTAATGSGTTDPANDNTNYVASSYVRTSSLPQSSEMDNGASNPALLFNGSVRSALGVINAATRTQILNVSGRGACGFLGLFKHNSGGGLVEVIVDGITIMSYTTSTTNATSGHVLIGAPGGATVSSLSLPMYAAIADGSPVQFRRTFVVWYTPATNASGSNATLGYDIKALR